MTDYDDLLRSLLVERFGAWVNNVSAATDEAVSARAVRSPRRVCSRELRVRLARPMSRQERVEAPVLRADGDQAARSHGRATPISQPEARTSNAPERRIP